MDLFILGILLLFLGAQNIQYMFKIWYYSNVFKERGIYDNVKDMKWYQLWKNSW